MVISAHTYDAVSFAMKSFQSKKLFNLKFEGLTGIKITPGYKVTPHKRFLIHISESGYREWR